MFFPVASHTDAKNPPHFAQIGHFVMVLKGFLVLMDTFQAFRNEPQVIHISADDVRECVG